MKDCILGKRQVAKLAVAFRPSSLYNTDIKVCTLCHATVLFSLSATKKCKVFFANQKAA